MSYERFELQPPKFNEEGKAYFLEIKGLFHVSRREEYLDKDGKYKIKFCLVFEGGVLTESRQEFESVKFSSLSREEKSELLSYLTEKHNARIPVGVKWCFLRDHATQSLYAYGANLKQLKLDDVQVEAERQALIGLLTQALQVRERPHIPLWKITKYAALALLILYTGFLTFIFLNKLAKDPIIEDKWDIPTAIQDEPTPPKDISKQPLWDFYHKNFPVVYSWYGNSGAAAIQQELSDKIIKYSHIENLLRHTKQQNWQQISFDNDEGVLADGEYDRTRMILFDFFNNNREIHDIWADEKNREVLKDTNFAKLINIYSTYAYKYKMPQEEPLSNKVFYWQAGDLGINKDNLDSLLLKYQIAYDDWKEDYNPNKDYIKGSFNFATRFVSVTDGSEKKDRWFVAVYKHYDKDLPTDKWTYKVTLFKYGETSVVYADDFMALKENKQVTIKGKIQVIDWYIVPADVASKLGFSNSHRKTYTEDNSVESEIVFMKTDLLISQGDFQPVAFNELTVDQPRTLIMQNAKTGERYGFNTSNPITAYVLLNILRDQTLRDAEVYDVERRENSVLESHILLAKDLPLEMSPSTKAFPRTTLDKFADLPKFTAKRAEKEFIYYNQAQVKYSEPYMFQVDNDTNVLKLNACLPGARAELPFGTYYMVDKQNGEGCQLSDKP